MNEVSNKPRLIIENDSGLPDRIIKNEQNKDLFLQYGFDRLEQIFREQEIFTARIYKPYEDKPFNCYNFDKETFDLFYTLVRAQIELSEALGEIDKHTKIWKQDKGEPYNKQKILTELIDTAKFIHQAILFLGFNADKYYLDHTQKNEKNHKRQDDGY